MSTTTQTKLSLERNQMIFDLSKGMAITHLSLGEETVTEIISPQSGYHYESSLLFPFPNRLANGRFTFEGTVYQFICNDFGMPNALHGLIHNYTFLLTDQGQSASKAWATAELTETGTNSSFPFPFKLSVTYTLTHTALDMKVNVTNTGKTNMPFGLGWHPYFNLPQEASQSFLKLPSSYEMKVDSHLLPTGEKSLSTDFHHFKSLKGVKLDTCFETIENQVNSTFVKLNNRKTLEVWQDKTYPFIQVFTPEDGKTIAIEPMTCNIDALNNQNGLQILSPTETQTFSCGVRLLV